MIKFFTKKDKRIQELEQKLLNMINPQQLLLNETNLIPCMESIILKDNMTIESVKRIIAREIEEKLIDQIECEFKDYINNRKILEGTLYVGNRKM